MTYADRMTDITSQDYAPVTIDRNPEWQEEFFELLRIPSVSPDPAHAADIRRAADWVVDFIESAGGTAEIIADGHPPVVVSAFEASGGKRDDVPTVLLYAHLDVMPPGDDELWDSPAFEPEVRDGLIYARGSSDDKSSVYIILRTVCDLHKAGNLPVNVRLLIDGEEEVDGEAVVKWVENTTIPIDVAMVLDGVMQNDSVPMLTIGARGLISWKLRVRTGDQDLHSGLYGGVGLNAVHSLIQILQAVMGDSEALREGAIEISEEHLAEWDAIADGPEQLRSAGGRPVSQEAVDAYYRHIFALPSFSVNGITGGEVRLRKTIIPVEAEANISMRLAPGQDVARIHAIFERLIEDVRPQNCDVSLELEPSSAASMTDPENPFVQAAIAPFERVFGAKPVLLPMGATVPILAAVAGRGIPAVHSGFGRPDANFHAPNERFPLEHLWLGIAAIREALFAFAEVSPREQRS